MNDRPPIAGAFNARSRPPLSPEELRRQPAVMFERDTGLTGVAHSYTFPGGMTGRQFEDTYFWQRHHKPAVLEQVKIPESKFTELPDDVDNVIAQSSPHFTKILQYAWKNLVKLNPSLKTVKIDTSSPNQLYDALNGVASSFNPDDISYYLRKQWVEKTSPFLETAAATRAVESRTGVRPEWAASPATLRQITKQLDKRDQRNAQTRLYSAIQPKA